MAFFVYDRPISSTFTYNGDVYEVVESSDDTCEGCSLENDVNLCYECPFYCSKKSRLDGKDVIFKSLTQINNIMHDVVEIATGVVISEWTTEKEAQEQVDRFNKSANGEYYKVRKHIDSSIINE